MLLIAPCADLRPRSSWAHILSREPLIARVPGFRLPRVSDCADSHSGWAVTRDVSIPHVDQVAWRGRVFTLFRAGVH